MPEGDSRDQFTDTGRDASIRMVRGLARANVLVGATATVLYAAQVGFDTIDSLNTNAELVTSGDLLQLTGRAAGVVALSAVTCVMGSMADRLGKNGPYTSSEIRDQQRIISAINMQPGKY